MLPDAFNRMASGHAYGAALPPRLLVGKVDASCADFVGTDALQACLRRGNSYQACNTKSTIHAGMRACDDARPCRQDYVCAHTANERVGACVPPYFVFPLRLDGYPLKH